MLKSTVGGEPAWAVEAEGLLADAERAEKEHRSELAWRLLLDAQRLCLHGLRAANPAAFRARAGTLRDEGIAKLRSWRRARVEALARTAPSPAQITEPVTDHEFAAANEATSILFEHFANETIKRRAQRSQTVVLIILAVGEFVAWWFVAGPKVFDAALTGSHIEWSNVQLTLSVMLFGLLGAAFSALISLASDAKDQTIPEQAFTYRITLARQVVGALSALAIYVLLASGFVKIGEMGVNPPLLLLAAFASGFSERLVVRALDRFSAASDGKGDARPRLSA